MTKIRDIKGIVEKLPDFMSSPRWQPDTEEDRKCREVGNRLIKTILNTNINLEDIVEVDVGKLVKLLSLGDISYVMNANGKDSYDPKVLADYLAKAGILKWREDK